MTGTGSARLLPQRLELFDVPDIEDVARRVLKGYCTKNGTRLGLADQEDCVAFLVAEAWIVSERFDASRGAPFSAIIRVRLSFRCTDWMRGRLGRSTWKFSSHTYTRERPVPLSLDGGAPGDEPGRSLSETLADERGDLAADRDTDGVSRLLNARAVEADRDFECLRAAAARDLEERTRATVERGRQRRLAQIG